MKNNSFYYNIKSLWRHFEKRRKIQLFILFFLMIITSLAEAFSIGSILPFLSFITDPEKIFHSNYIFPIIKYFNLTNSSQLLMPLTFIFLSAIIFSCILRLVLLWAQTKLGFSIGGDFSFKIFQNTLYQPYQIHLERNSSDVISGISNKVNFVIYQTLLPIFSFISSFLMIIIILIALISINYQVALTSFFCIGIIYFIIIMITKSKLVKFGDKVNQESNNVIRVLQEGLGGIRDVLIDGSQDTFSQTYKKADQSLRNSQSSIAIISGSPRFLLEALGMSVMVVIAYSISNNKESLTSILPLLGAMALGSQRLLPIVQQIYVNWTSIIGAKASLSDIIDLLDQPLPYYFKQENKHKKIKFENFLLGENIYFSYDNNSSLILNNINFKISKGTKVGFIGSTGSGKSTLLDIIMSLLLPTKGKLKVDDIEINSTNYRSLQSIIAHVPQSIFLSDCTIAENIAFGIPYNKIDFNRVHEAAVNAKISDVILSWDKQYNTIVGERGSRLSGGQKQRIAIARALYKKADILIFDEATSALDNDTELDIINQIEKLGNNLTIIFVAHRLTTLKYCDVIFQLENGCIIKSGNYNELITQKY